jgi:hypothetical protein
MRGQDAGAAGGNGAIHPDEFPVALPVDHAPDALPAHGLAAKVASLAGAMKVIDIELGAYALKTVGALAALCCEASDEFRCGKRCPGRLMVVRAA